LNLKYELDSENFRSEGFSLEFFIGPCNLSGADHPCGVFHTLGSLLRFFSARQGF